MLNRLGDMLDELPARVAGIVLLGVLLISAMASAVFTWALRSWELGAAPTALVCIVCVALVVLFIWMVTRLTPLAGAPAMILIAAAVSGGYLLITPVSQKQADLELWTFAQTHFEGYRAALPAFTEKSGGLTVDVQFVNNQAVTTRLRAAFRGGMNVPDLAEVQLNQSGSFLRGPLEDVGFINLRPYLVRDGLMGRIVKSRLDGLTVRGQAADGSADYIYGVPHDVHPTMIAYRKDIFDAEGVDVSKIVTWDDFIAVGRRLSDGQRFMIHFDDDRSGTFDIMMHQRGGGYFDADGQLVMDSEIALDTLLWYVPLVSGGKGVQISQNFGSHPFAVHKHLSDGVYLSVICADWRTRMIELNQPELAGKMALMAMPVFAVGQRRTSVSGGTMIGITKRCENPDAAWELVKHLYYNLEGSGELFRSNNILPPFRDAWVKVQGVESIYDEPREYWGGQRIGRLYADLADETPTQHGSPFLELAKGKMGEVVAATCSYYRKHGEEGFEQYTAQRLKQAADYVRFQMTRNPF